MFLGSVGKSIFSVYSIFITCLSSFKFSQGNESRFSLLSLFAKFLTYKTKFLIFLPQAHF